MKLKKKNKLHSSVDHAVIAFTASLVRNANANAQASRQARAKENAFLASCPASVQWAELLNTDK